MPKATCVLLVHGTSFIVIFKVRGNVLYNLPSILFVIIYDFSGAI